MEKQNFKNKVTGAVIDLESYNKLPMNVKNDFYLTAEEPTHKVELESGKHFLDPIILDEETGKGKTVNTVNESNVGDATLAGETLLTKEQAEQSTSNEPPAKKNKVKGDKN